MSIIDTIAKRLGYQKALIKPPDYLRASVEAERQNIPDASLYENQAELFERLSWVYSAVSVVSQMLATVPLNVKKIRGEKLMDIPNHPFETLMRRPNPLQSRYEFLYATAAYRLLTGNAYWYVNRASENDEPDELWVIPSYKILPIPDGNSYIKGYAYEPGGADRKIELEPWQVVHFKDFHPNNLFMGLSRVEPIATTATADMQMQKWNSKYFGENNARLPGILAFSDMIGDSDWDLIKRDIDTSASKRQFLLLRGTGAGAVAWLQAASTIKDMEFLAGRTFNKEEIYNVFAPGLSSVLAVNATEANARTGKSTLIEFSVYPGLVSIAERITSDILPAYSVNNKQITYVAEFDDVRITDRVVELQEMNEYARTHTIDEIRERYYEDGPISSSTNETDIRGWMLPGQIDPNAPMPKMEGEAEPEGPQPVTTAPEAEEEQAEPEETEEPEIQEPPEETEGPEVEPTESIPSEVEAGELDAMRVDMIKWRNKAVNRLRDGKKADVKFTSDAIPKSVMGAIMGALASASTPADVNRIFSNALLWRGYP